MTSYGAYNAGLPCKNPNCKSQGKPHPNCKCYGEMAEGGEVKHFCESNNEHNPDCEYFADGGEAQALPTMQFENPIEAIAGYVAHHGATGLLNKKLNDPLDKYYGAIKKGHRRLHDSSEALFASQMKFPEVDTTKSKKTLEDWMEKGSAYDDVQNALSGGEIDPKQPLQTTELSNAHPDHNLLLQTTKGRVSDYLNSLKPQFNAPRLSFDSEPDLTEQKRTYKKALEIANNPLSVLREVKKGTLEPLHVKHFSAMFPELNDAVQKTLTQKIINSQLKGEKPDYKTRLGLSLFMGANLSSDVTPQNIQAAQATFVTSQPPPMPQGGQSQKKTKGSKSALSKSDQSYLTSNQSLTGRSQKQ